MALPAFYARMSTLERILYLVFAVGPLAGSLCGFVTAVLGFTVTLIYVGEPQSILAALFLGGPVCGILGGIFGFFCMTLAAWSLCNEDPFTALRYLAGGTLLFALGTACIPNAVSISHFTGFVGFWVGFTLLKVRNFKREDWLRFVFGESGYGW